jgi:AraC-like DNA-binding protein
MDDLRTITRRVLAWVNTAPEVPLAFAETNLTEELRTDAMPLVEFVLVTRGPIPIRAGSRGVTASTGDIAVLNAHFGNWGDLSAPGARYSCVSLDVLGVRELSDLGRGPLLTVRGARRDGRLPALYREVSLLHHSPGRRHALLLVKAALLHLLAEVDAAVGRAPSDCAAADGRLRAALDVMEDRLGDPGLSLPEIAAAASISVSQLGRLFRKAAGETPMGRLCQLRLARARALLLRGELSVKQVARLSGYRDQLYFSRVFRRHCGVCPTAYRARVCRARGEAAERRQRVR